MCFLSARKENFLVFRHFGTRIFKKNKFKNNAKQNLTAIVIEKLTLIINEIYSKSSKEPPLNSVTNCYHQMNLCIQNYFFVE